MGKVSWTKDQRAKAKQFGLPLISIAIDGKHLPESKDDFRGGMAIDGPATSKEMAKKVSDLIIEFCKEAGRLEAEDAKD